MGHHGNTLNLFRRFLGLSLGPFWGTLLSTWNGLELIWNQLELVLGLSWALFGAILTSNGLIEERSRAISQPS